MSEKFSTKIADILFVVRSALGELHEGKVIQAYELLSEMYDSVSEQIRDDNPQKTEWIPVSERLPEIDEYVLVADGITMYIGWIDSTDNKWRVDSEDSYFINEVDVIAWMPLPEPYKAKSKENE